MQACRVQETSFKNIKNLIIPNFVNENSLNIYSPSRLLNLYDYLYSAGYAKQEKTDSEWPILQDNKDTHTKKQSNLKTKSGRKKLFLLEKIIGMGDLLAVLIGRLFQPSERAQ